MVYVIRFVVSQCSSSSKTEKHDKSPTSLVSDSRSRVKYLSQVTLSSNLFVLSSSVSETYWESSDSELKQLWTSHDGWTAAVKRAFMASGAIRRFQERVLGPSRNGIYSTTSEIWLLGICYKLCKDESSGETDAGNVLAAFKQDFSSKILMTYRKGFDHLGDTTYTSDVGWGCMLRSSQMLFAQALLFHRLGRSWRRKDSQPHEPEYLETLELFGDSEASAFSINNLILAGQAYGLAVGSWVGPYAVCRAWESLACESIKQADIKHQRLPMAVHIVSGREDGERGGAPILCIDDASKSCSVFSEGQAEWTPILLLVPLVLGLDKVNPRYIPSLVATFTFPQSLGILGGKPGASTYIVGVQEDKGFYLDPHEAQQVVSVSKGTPDVDTSSYHCSLLRYVPLESLDPSLALGFYCRNKDDFDDLCLRASKLAEESDGAPLFTVSQTHNPASRNSILPRGSWIAESDAATKSRYDDEHDDDEWQLL